MSQPVKLSDDLIRDARVTGEILNRSMAGQIEFWATLGRALEPLLDGVQVLALQRAGRVKAISACLAAVDTSEGRRRVSKHLKDRPYPHYQAHAKKPGLLVRIEADGKRSVGRFIDRRWKAGG